MKSPKYFLVVDLEATCDEDHRIPRDETEIIEIGAVVLDGETLAPLDELQTFVRPMRHPKLTPFCTRLTTITQADVDQAPRFPQAIAALTAFLSRYPGALLSSWGGYDQRQLEREARRH